jgi:hypothetical protein
MQPYTATSKPSSLMIRNQSKHLLFHCKLTNSHRSHNFEKRIAIYSNLRKELQKKKGLIKKEASKMGSWIIE